MTNTKIIEAVAKLDGYKLCSLTDLGYTSPLKSSDIKSLWTKDLAVAEELPAYLTSRDAIIPVILKQDKETQREVYQQLFRERFVQCTETTVRFTVSLEEIFHKNATNLCEALLRALNLWEES